MAGYRAIVAVANIVLAEDLAQMFAMACRHEQAEASLASGESSPDECLVAEGWIVAGTIMMSNRTNGEQACA